jgi:hypothetical protein
MSVVEPASVGELRLARVTGSDGRRLQGELIATKCAS